MPMDAAHPAVGREALSWTLEWWDGEAVRLRSLEWDGLGTPELSVPVSQSGAEAVVAVLRGRSPVGAGSIAPQGGWVRSGVDALDLAWSRGAAAAVLVELARIGLRPGRVDLERLEQALVREQTLAGSGTDDSRLDSSALRSALARDRMRRSAVRMVERSPAAVSLPVPVGRTGYSAPPLYTDEPASPPLAGHRQGDEWLWSVGVAPGERRSFWPAGQMLTIEVQRDAAGRLSVRRWPR